MQVKIKMNLARVVEDAPVSGPNSPARPGPPPAERFPDHPNRCRPLNVRARKKCLKEEYFLTVANLTPPMALISGRVKLESLSSIFLFGRK